MNLNIPKEDLKIFLAHLLKKSPINIEFTKTNGELRKMVCTTNPNLIPGALITEEHKSSELSDTFRVFDLEKDEWRSFKIESLLKINDSNSYYEVIHESNSK